MHKVRKARGSLFLLTKVFTYRLSKGVAKWFPIEFDINNWENDQRQIYRYLSTTFLYIYIYIYDNAYINWCE